ncbi:MAG: hypothetical protein MUO43_02640, partial [Desulfobacterales bacterium]|nr:hypothetical protein [Desulfobacterales bacterium]
ELNIKEIKQKDNSVEIFANVEEPAGGIDVITSPYTIMQVKRSEIARGKITFKFFINKEIVEKTVEID